MRGQEMEPEEIDPNDENWQLEADGPADAGEADQ